MRLGDLLIVIAHVIFLSMTVHFIYGVLSSNVSLMNSILRQN